jgi:uncharacterized membrane protein
VSPTEPPRESKDDALMLVMAYLGPLCLVPLLLEKSDPIVRWHARHGLVLLIADCALLASLGIVATLVSFATFGLLASVIIVLSGVASLALVILHALMIVKALSGERLLIPGISEHADRL